MSEPPRLCTERLVLRPFTLEDAKEVQRLAGHWDVASTTANIPYPYEDGMAEDWISTHQETFEKGEGVVYAITLKDGRLLGAISLMAMIEDHQAELGYWIGKPYWNQGYCTEAGKELLRYGFDVLGLNRIHASHISRNPASGRVMQKLGMSYEGERKQHVKRWGVFYDLVLYGILISDWNPKSSR
jgi:RimJ/RimL family protein N-acetyltransferase